MGLALHRQGKLDDAIAHYSEALRIKPDYANARRNLSLALQQAGKHEEGSNTPRAP
jgi:tetratricopeptide (TPR) repeat protein